jgi:hypothetical protein
MSVGAVQPLIKPEPLPTPRGDLRWVLDPIPFAERQISGGEVFIDFTDVVDYSSITTLTNTYGTSKSLDHIVASSTLSPVLTYPTTLDSVVTPTTQPINPFYLYWNIPITDENVTYNLSDNDPFYVSHTQANITFQDLTVYLMRYYDFTSTLLDTQTFRISYTSSQTDKLRIMTYSGIDTRSNAAVLEKLRWMYGYNDIYTGDTAYRNSFGTTTLSYYDFTTKQIVLNPPNGFQSFNTSHFRRLSYGDNVQLFRLNSNYSVQLDHTYNNQILLYVVNGKGGKITLNLSDAARELFFNEVFIKHQSQELYGCATRLQTKLIDYLK